MDALLELLNAGEASLWAMFVVAFLAATVLPIGSEPLLVALVLWIRIHDGGPALFRQTRVGREGVEFTCLKLRSMSVDAEARLAEVEARDHVLVKSTADPRVTRPGRLIRRLSLDELPQLWNVLRGEMSLVGPRPVVADEIAEHYGADAADYYLAVRPGITGLWQVSGRSTRSYAERVALDVDYVRRMSPARDAAILLRTVAVVLVRRGAY